MTYRTMEEEFDIAKKGLLKQNKKSTANTLPGIPAGPWDCRYRGEGSTCCALGFLLEDEAALEMDSHVLVPLKEGDFDSVETLQGIRKNNDRFFKMSKTLNPDHLKFYTELQYIHDSIRVEQWEKSFDILEEKWFSTESL